MGTKKNIFRSVWHGKNKYVVIAGLAIITIVLILFIGPISGGAIESIGYTQGSQGMNWSFDSVYWNNYWWNSTTQGLSPSAQDGGSTSTASSLGFGNDLNLNPDGPNNGFPALCGTFGSFYADTAGTSGLNKVYSWQIPVGKDSQGNTIYHQYQMQRVYCTMSFNVYLSGTGTEASAPGGTAPNYAGAQVWIKLTPNNFVYFQGNPQAVYFAPEYIGLTNNVQWSSAGGGSGGLNNDQLNSLIQEQSTNPQAKGDVFGIYYNRGGSPVNFANGGQNNLLSYQGQALDPQIFRNNYYIKLTLNDFLAYNNWGWLYSSHQWAFPSAHFDLTVYMFVVGQWTVTVKSGETPQQVNHPIVGGSNDIFAGLSALFSNPLYDLMILGAIFIIVVVLVVVFFPGVVGLANTGANSLSHRIKNHKSKSRR